MQKNNKARLNFKKTYKKKQVLVLLILIFFAISFVVILARYVTDNTENFFLRSKAFYFYSDKLSDNLSTFQIDNWSGVDEYTITINMNSKKNNLLFNLYDIAYDITYTCTDNAICQISKTSGVISANDNTDQFNLIITPNSQYNTGDQVVVYVEAKSKTNYEKVLKGKFTLVVGKEDLTYQITDSPKNVYLDLSITNTLSYYIVNESFGNYTKNQKIDIDTYLSLSEENKLKCYSNIAKVEFNPNDVLLDMTNENYSKVTDIKVQNINGKDYISGFTISIDAISSVNFRFYKINVEEDYSYPENFQTSIINVQEI